MKKIQSLERAFDILEALAAQVDTSVSLGEIARSVGLHPATCAHLIGTMVDRGYVEQLGRRKGYQLGSMVHYLSRNIPYGGDLTARAQPLMEKLAEELGEWVVLTAMAGLRRLVLLEINGSSRAVQVDRSALRMAEKAYNSASIWLFLAHMEPSMRDRFLELHGKPEPTTDCSSFEDRLARIREDGFSVYEDKLGEVKKVAFPIWQDGMVTAAVGVHLPAFRLVGSHRSMVIAGLSTLARQLS